MDGNADLSITIGLVPLDDLQPYDRNARAHPPEQVEQIKDLIREFGFTNPILADLDDGGTIAAGHGRRLALLSLFEDGETVKLPNGRDLPEGFAPVIDCSGWSIEQRRAYTLADNKVGENGGWLDEILAVELSSLLDEAPEVKRFTGFTDKEIRKLTAALTGGLGGQAANDAPPAPDAPVSRVGDVWQLGPHRVMCGSSSETRGNEFLSGVDLVLTDPPYCSGGFQESDRFIGSVGTNRDHKAIANDRLSTRGYQALMRSAVYQIDAPFFYVFTDWRMWSSLFDISESAGASVRSMIVWNKGTPGMGVGWRAQHELVMWSARLKPEYNPGDSGKGNVITLPRQRNDLHTTQKPIEIIDELLDGAEWCKTVADPFLGSGTTLIACEKRGIPCRGIELDPAYVDVIVERWQGFTGKIATLDGDGRTFSEVKAERNG